MSSVSVGLVGLICYALPDTTALSSADKVQKALDKLFDECDSRQRSLGELYIRSSFFVEYFCRACRVSPGTRQRKVVVTAPSGGDVAFIECLLD
jgi:hypothetical protein